MPSYATPHAAEALSRRLPPRANHIVHISPNDHSLEASLLEYFSVGLARGDTCIVIATPQTIISLNKGLRAKGINLSSVIDSNQYLAYDAEDLLAHFMQGKLPDPVKFLKTIGGIMTAATNRARPVRVFGEIVAVLLRQNNVAALLRLEKYWNNLINDYSFSLYCTYPEANFEHRPHARELLHGIRACHTLAIDKLLD